MIVIRNLPCQLPKGKATWQGRSQVTVVIPTFSLPALRLHHTSFPEPPSTHPVPCHLPLTSLHSHIHILFINYPSAASSPTWPGLSCHPTEPTLFNWDSHHFLRNDPHRASTVFGTTWISIAKQCDHVMCFTNLSPNCLVRPSPSLQYGKTLPPL